MRRKRYPTLCDKLFRSFRHSHSNRFVKQYKRKARARWWQHRFLLSVSGVGGVCLILSTCMILLRDRDALSVERAPHGAGRRHPVKKGETLSDLCRLYGVTLSALLAANTHIRDPDLIYRSDTLVIPSSAHRLPRTRRATASSTPLRTTAFRPQFQRPVSGRESSGFGPRWGRSHNGIDIAAPLGETVVAADAGTVTFADHFSSYGYIIILTHAGGYETRYAHLAPALRVTAGKVFRTGEWLGRVGLTGRSSGPHVHFEVRYRNEPIDPTPFFA